MSSADSDYEILDIPRPPHLGGGVWNLRQLTPISIILGKNGSGKSQLLRAIKDMNHDRYYYCVPERAGDTTYNIKFAQQNMTSANRAGRASANFSPDYRQHVVSKIQTLIMKIGHTHGIINPLEIRSSIEEMINDLFSEFEFKITDADIPFSLTRKSDPHTSVSSAQLSSGETQIFTLALDLVLMCEIWKLENTIGTLLIDEPDLHLHSELQQKFSAFLVKLNKKYSCSIIVSTHSTTLLSALGHYGNEKTSIVYLKNEPNLKSLKFDETLQTMSTCLGGHILMGSLFNFPILLVEGDDDYRTWSEIPRYNQILLSVIPCGGSKKVKEYQKTLEKIFASLLDSKDKPSGFALLDGDQPVSNSTEKKHVKSINLACHELENLYLSDEVLSDIGTNWDEVCENVIANSAKYGNKNPFLKTICDWNRKTVDCKSVINELSWIIDKKNVLWTMRIGQTLGRRKPEGQLLDFLGSDVISAIWNV